MTIEEVFNRAKQIKSDITLPLVVNFINDCLDEMDVTSYKEKDYTYTAGSGGVELDSIFEQKVDTIKKVIMDKNGIQYIIPIKPHRGNSKYFYELQDRTLVIKERDIQGNFNNVSEDLDLTISVEVLPADVSIDNPSNSLPVDENLHSAIKEYVLWHTFVAKADSSRSPEASKQAMYMSKYHTKRFYDKVQDNRRGDIGKDTTVVVPDKTTSIR